MTYQIVRKAFECSPFADRKSTCHYPEFASVGLEADHSCTGSGDSRHRETAGVVAVAANLVHLAQT